MPPFNIHYKNSALTPFYKKASFYIPVEIFTSAQNEESAWQCLSPNRTLVTQHLMEYHKRSEKDGKRLRTRATAA